MVRIGLFGCGRIGRMHAENIQQHPRAQLVAVYDVHEPSAAAVAAATDAALATTAASIIGDPGVDAVLIASSTDTHVDLLQAAALAGKAVFCEKPIDLDIARVDACRKAIAGCYVPIQIAFNRRFDPGHRAARDAALAGDIGALHQVIITSRDPAVPPEAYLRRAGGLFRDMTIHDLDLARFMLGEEPVDVFALAGRQGAPALGELLDDHDEAMIILRTASGRLCHINNSRIAVYGYDQRVELLGSAGMLLSDNRRAHELKRYGREQTESAEPLLDFFVDRYREAFGAQLAHFIACVEEGTTPEVGFDDGRRALLLANAAYASVESGSLVRVEA